MAQPETTEQRCGFIALIGAPNASRRGIPRDVVPATRTDVLNLLMHGQFDPWHGLAERAGHYAIAIRQHRNMLPGVIAAWPGRIAAVIGAKYQQIVVAHLIH